MVVAARAAERRPAEGAAAGGRQQGSAGGSGAMRRRLSAEPARPTAQETAEAHSASPRGVRSDYVPPVSGA